MIEAQPCVRGISGQLSPTQLCNSPLFSLIEAHLSHAGGRSADCRGMRGGCGLEPSGLWHACLSPAFYTAATHFPARSKARQCGQHPTEKHPRTPGHASPQRWGQIRLPPWVKQFWGEGSGEGCSPQPPFSSELGSHRSAFPDHSSPSLLAPKASAASCRALGPHSWFCTGERALPWKQGLCSHVQDELTRWGPHAVTGDSRDRRA